VDDHPEYRTFPGLVILRVDGELFFANARWFEDTVRELVSDTTPPVREVLVHAGAVPHIDTTAADVVKELIADLREHGVELAFARATTELYEHLERKGIVALVGQERFHDTVAAGVADFLRREGGPADQV
jgi:SulP family sulfate permease